MPLRWHIDECSPRWIFGWIDDDGPVDAIEIAVNGRRIATVSPTEYRKDLEDAGFGDGRRAFSLPISQYLDPAELTAVVAISHGERLLHSATVELRAARMHEAAAPKAAQIPVYDRENEAAEPASALLLGARRILRSPPNRDECEFYHVVDLPDGTTSQGQWDLRNTADEYLGNVNFAGKRVIEIGPASGFLSFQMEKRGARVAVVEPPMESFWDLVPQAEVNLSEIHAVFGAHIERIRNSFWFLHDCYNSRVESYEADAYRLPPQPQKFDIGVLASVLLHVSSPVRMLESIAAAVAGQIIIVERHYPELDAQPVCRLVPSAQNRALETWWEFSPRFFEQYLRVLGFRHFAVTHHHQYFAITKEECAMFTMVAAR